jgi:UDP-N-acetylmuramoyl-L-alanyl-D-glutamate--2,6-diaminopimelate ligase
VFTNLSQDHLDYHPSMEAYFEAKACLFEAPLLGGGADAIASENRGSVVVNGDDAWGARLIERLKPRLGERCWCSSLVDTSAELHIRGLELGAAGMAGTLVSPVGEGRFTTPLVGAFNAMNLLQAAGALLQQGLPLPALLEGLASFNGVPGRMERVTVVPEGASTGAREGALPAVVVDYAHTPDAVDKALQALRPWAHARGGRVMCILGCGGNRDTSKRAPMARMAERGADLVCLTSDNPRHEDPQHILAQMRQGLQRPEQAMQLVDRAQAIAQVIALAQAEDVVLIAGKGHETYQDIQGVMHGFSDVDHAELALHQWGQA